VLTVASRAQIPMVAIDSYYYGKLAFAPLNIVLYNVFTSHGPNLYGIEPLSYYLLNGMLNFNLLFLLALAAPLLLVSAGAGGGPSAHA
jgi:alpha-1,2-mannosyltransferase